MWICGCTCQAVMVVNNCTIWKYVLTCILICSALPISHACQYIIYPRLIIFFMHFQGTHAGAQRWHSHADWCRGDLHGRGDPRGHSRLHGYVPGCHPRPETSGQVRMHAGIGFSLSFADISFADMCWVRALLQNLFCPRRTKRQGVVYWLNCVTRDGCYLLCNIHPPYGGSHVKYCDAIAESSSVFPTWAAWYSC